MSATTSRQKAALENQYRRFSVSQKNSIPHAFLFFITSVLLFRNVLGMASGPVSSREGGVAFVPATNRSLCRSVTVKEV